MTWRPARLEDGQGGRFAVPVAQGVSANATTYFTNPCGYTGEVYAQAYAEARTADDALVTMTKVDPLTAGGSDLWGTADAFHFVHQTLTGDGESVANVASLLQPVGANWTLGGVTFRNDLTAGSVHATMMVTSQGEARFRRRTTAGGTTLSDGFATGTRFPPRWVKLVRSGNVFTASISADDRQMCGMSDATQTPCTQQMTDRNLQLACYGMSIDYGSNCRDITDPNMRMFCYGVSYNYVPD
ncbi:MAG TPA: hypothetical protein VE685_00270 [Thermoanaerobaculia bacterium]|nr:hypothetical protein [Thermoanaerobaculia bacterium]